MWLFNLLFSSLSQLWYVEVRISRSVSVSPLEFEITGVDYICCTFIFILFLVQSYIDQPASTTSLSIRRDIENTVNKSWKFVSLAHDELPNIISELAHHEQKKSQLSL